MKLLRDAFMLKLNERNALGGVNTQDVKIVAFWEQTYLPFIKENLRPSTVHGYQKIWQRQQFVHRSCRQLQMIVDLESCDLVLSQRKGWAKRKWAAKKVA